MSRNKQNSSAPHKIRSYPPRMMRLLSSWIIFFAFGAFAFPVCAQISFTTAVDLALRSNPRVLSAQADVDRARAALSESRDVYIPTLVGGSGLGYSYGFPVGQPTLFNFSSQSLLVSFSQHDYIRAARFSLTAAILTLRDARQAAAEDAATAYLTLDHDMARVAALQQQLNYANKLVEIVQERLAAGQDTQIGLTSARLTAAQLKLAKLQADDAADMDGAHLARLTGLPRQGLSTIPGSVPAFPPIATSSSPANPYSSPAVESAYKSARAKQEIAFGDARYLYRPQVYFVAQYNRFSTFNNYQTYYQPNSFQANNALIGIQLSLPIFDPVHQAKARESAADAVHARHDADFLRDQLLDARLKARHSTEELAARADIAGLDQQLAQQQLDAMLVQIQNGTGTGGAPMTPKDEQTARIAEREKYISVLDDTFQMQQAEIDLLRQTGELEPWLKSVAAGGTPTSFRP